MSSYEKMIERAREHLAKMTKSEYAQSVLDGYESLSGASLRGNARKWKHYSRMRELVIAAIQTAGGTIIQIAPGNRKVPSVAVEAEIDGETVTAYLTRDGLYHFPARAKSARQVQS